MKKKDFYCEFREHMSINYSQNEKAMLFVLLDPELVAFEVTCPSCNVQMMEEDQIEKLIAEVDSVEAFFDAIPWNDHFAMECNPEPS